MLSAAQMLDELMGRDRNLAPTEKRREIHWEDADVCKYFLCGFCPHELFVNTRADLGQCEKFHDEKLKASYEKSSRYECMGYEEEFLRFLQTLLADVERRIRKGQARLTLNNSQGGVSNMASGPQVAREEKISMLTEKINSLVQQAEELGCEGKVEDAQGMMKLCEQLTEERTQLENSSSFSIPPVKEMEVCEICGAYLVIGDSHNRLSEHLKGKLHMGMAEVRITIDTLQKKLRDEGAEREAKRAKEREERDKEREARDKEREEYRKKREQEDKERAEKRRHRSRSKSRSKRRSRSRSPGGRRHRRSRSRDRRRRTRSRDREGRSTRSRDRRHSRHASRDRKSREKSSRHRDRSRERSSRRSRAKDEDMDVKEKMKTDGSGDQKLAEDSESATNMDTNDSASLPASSTKDHDGQEN